ncbi:hypothetical protein KY320_03570 [Candidatus Woesearchaeota archaeon]|nr:hypothetical protein [Candidatus Woesearchaeota archaeon]
MANKKGDKSLSMIFGLFILLIISLVVLSLFFRFTERSTGTIEETQESFFHKQAMEQAISQCQTACSSITDVNTALEFCRKYQKIDFSGDKEASSITKVDWGQWQFCEDRIPCFILTECKSGLTVYDGAKCKDYLLNKRKDYYNGLEYSQAEVGAGKDTKAGTCGLDTSATTPEEIALSPNWVVKYGYHSP